MVQKKYLYVSLSSREIQLPTLIEQAIPNALDLGVVPAQAWISPKFRHSRHPSVAYPSCGV